MPGDVSDWARWQDCADGFGAGLRIERSLSARGE